MTDEQFASLVQRLEGYSREHASVYKVRVLLLACLGYLYIFFIVGVATALITVLGLALFATKGNILVIKLGIKLGLPLLLLIAVIMRALWVRLEAPAGIRLSRQAYPELFAMLDEIRNELSGPNVHAVLMTDQFNASVVQIPRLGLLGWQKNYLVIGLPLMQALTPTQFKAVLAHEYGHLSGAHGKMSAWIYRIRVTWYRLMQALDQQTHWGGFVFTKFFDWYAPYFNAYSFALARANEYEADRCAADVTGPSEAAAALVNVYVRGGFLDEKFWPNLYQQAENKPQPAFLPHQAMSAVLSKRLPEQESREWLQRALEEPTNLSDTHPSLSDRLDALGADPVVTDELEETAAQRFLGEALRGNREQFDRNWLDCTTPWWKERYRYASEGRDRLAQLRGRFESDETTTDEAWEYAKLVEEFEDSRRAIAIYRRILSDNAQHVGASYRLGCALLEQGDEEGIGLIENAMRERPELTVDGCQVLYTHFKKCGKHDEAQHWYRRAFERAQLETRAREERSSLRFSHNFLPHGLPAQEIEAITSQLKQHSFIKHAYLARVEVQYLPEYPLYVVGVVRKPRLSLRDDKKGATERLSSEINFARDSFYVVLEGDSKPLLKKLKKTPDTLLF